MLKASSKYYKRKEGKNPTDSRGGFTIVETLVAISILVIALTGPLSIIASSLKSSYFSRDEITAAYLAQEPIEHIRNLRDMNGLRESNSDFWLKGISTDLQGLGNQYINSPVSKSVKLGLIRDGVRFVLEPCNSCKLTYNDINGVYGEDPDLDPTLNDSIFTREVYLNQAHSEAAVNSELVVNRELVVTVIVSWSTGGISHNVTVTEHLFNWQLESED